MNARIIVYRCISCMDLSNKLAEEALESDNNSFYTGFLRQY